MDSGLTRRRFLAAASAAGVGLTFADWPASAATAGETGGTGVIRPPEKRIPPGKFPRVACGAQIKWFYREHPDCYSPERVAQDMERLHMTHLLLDGYHQAMGGWGPDIKGMPTEEYFEALGRRGLAIIMNASQGTYPAGMPIGNALARLPKEKKEEILKHFCRFMGGKKRPEVGEPLRQAGPCINDPVEMEWFLERNMMATLDRCGKFSAFQGILWDEPGWDGGYCERCEGLFREWLGKTFTPERLAKEGITDLSQVKPPLPMDNDQYVPRKHATPFLWGAFRHFANENFAERLKGYMEVCRRKAPGLAVAIVETPYKGLRFPLPFQASKICPSLDLMIVDGYLKAAIIQSFWAEMAASLNGNHWYAMDLVRSTPDVVRRDIYYTCMHARGIVLFDYVYLFRETGVYNAETKKFGAGKSYHPEMWKPLAEVVEKGLGDLAKQEDYLYKASTVSDIAIVISEDGIMNGFTGRYNTREDELWHYFVMTHIPSRVIYADLTDQYDQYKVLCWTSECMSDAQVEKVRSWVKGGGVFVSLNKDVSLYDAYGVERAQCGLEEVFGVNRKGETAGQGPKVDLAEVVSKGMVPEQGAPLRVLLDGNEMAVVNRYGQGLSVMFLENLFTKARLMEKAGKEGTGTWWQMLGKVHDQPVWQVCWSQVAEYALWFGKTPRSVVVEPCPSMVQINLRGQNFGSDVRRILHLLSRDEKPLISGVKARVLVPKGCQVEKVFDPIRDAQIPYAMEGEYVTFPVPPFEVYRSVVVGMRGGL